MNRRHKRNRVQPKVIDFEIEHIDPLGQGVSKKDGTVTFIAGTLPGETGTATVFKRAKGVQFAQLKELSGAAENRIEPACPHFEQCPGCQFLHTDYASELEYKKIALLRHLGRLGIEGDDVTVVPAPKRLGYRNRVQMHYRHKYIGMLDTVKNEVLEIPQCKVFVEELKPAFDDLQTGRWIEEHVGHGHCELYFRTGEVSVEWDQAYAHGGFSQVFDEMNKELQHRVQAQLEGLGVAGLLDLFSGTGNLSNSYASNGGYRVLIDCFTDASNGEMPENFHQMDLYEERTLPNFARLVDAAKFDCLLIDPPRKGFPALAEWVKKIKPQFVVYVSCNPASLAWDIKNLNQRYRVKDIQLLDLFPSTSHFETLVVLEIRKGQTTPPAIY